MKNDTQFASPLRSDKTELERQHQILNNSNLVKSIIDAMPNYTLILNMNRQIVFANKSFLNELGHDSIMTILGTRVGEALNCVHAFEKEGGCGTTEFCQMCGATNAILESQELKSSVKECRISANDNEAFDFLVWANPLLLEGEQFSVFAVVDISGEKRRRALERIFFHDILNTAGGLKGFIGLLKDSSPDELDELLKVTYEISERLIEEIEAQRELTKAESKELELNIRSFSTLQILKEIQTLYLNHDVAKDKKIVVDSNACDEIMSTDKGLLRRVLGNMLKNALEASKKEMVVTLHCQFNKLENSVKFSIHNSTSMSRDIQLQLFQRSFSTKATDRGLGTYSIKLFTEKYLEGTVGFSSNEEQGTTFFVEYPIILS